MTLKVYFDYFCDACRAVVLLLKELNVYFEANHVSILEGETRGEEYMKINELGGVPALDDNGFILTESVAVLKYIANKHKEVDHWYPTDLGQRARVDQFLSWHHTGLRRNIMGYFFAVFHKAGPVKIAEMKPATEKALNLLETYYLKDREFLATNDISIADLIGICEVTHIAAIGYDVTKDRPKLAAWMSKVQARLNPNLGDVHKKLVEVGKKYMIAE